MDVMAKDARGVRGSFPWWVFSVTAAIVVGAVLFANRPTPPRPRLSVAPPAPVVATTPKRAPTTSAAAKVHAAARPSGVVAVAKVHAAARKPTPADAPVVGFGKLPVTS